MQFQRLRLVGFKSFVDPAEVQIEAGLTGDCVGHLLQAVTALDQHDLDIGIDAINQGLVIGKCGVNRIVYKEFAKAFLVAENVRIYNSYKPVKFHQIVL